ncbi:hypothetical protein Q3G72_032046 [Acer saccharum]|nr:hypothetical protein Q3G72_032046 [Acer saccharum]
MEMFMDGIEYRVCVCASACNALVTILYLIMVKKRCKCLRMELNSVCTCLQCSGHSTLSLNDQEAVEMFKDGIEYHMILSGLKTLEGTGHPWTDDSHSFSVTLPLPKRQAFFVRSTTGLSTTSMKLESDQSTSKSIHHRTLPKKHVQRLISKRIQVHTRNVIRVQVTLCTHNYDNYRSTSTE